MKNVLVIIYSNQPVVISGEYCYTHMKNFIDFLIELAQQNSIYKLVVPAKSDLTPDQRKLNPIILPYNTLTVDYYEGHCQALISNFRNAFFIKRAIKEALTKNKTVVIAGPGPNSFMFWVSWFIPKSVRLVYFIRGDTLETIKHIYKGTALYALATTLVKIFRWRVLRMTEKSRALIFTFGDMLKTQYSVQNNKVFSIMPLISESFLGKNQNRDYSQKQNYSVLYVGRLSKEKNIMELIKAFEMSLQKELQVSLSIIGFGPLEHHIKDYIDANDLSNKVKFIGYRKHDELICELDRHHLLCLPSRTEGTPRVVVEAIARGLPVLASPVGSLPYLFENGIKYLDGFTAWDILNGIVWCMDHNEEMRLQTSAVKANIEKFFISKNAEFVDNKIREFVGENSFF